MSLLGHCLAHGSVVSWWREAEAKTGDGDRKTAAWTLVASGIPCVIETRSDDAMQNTYGTPEQIKDRIMVPGLHDMKPLDLLTATGGKRVGEYWRVEDVRPRDHGAADKHLDVAIKSTRETEVVLEVGS